MDETPKLEGSSRTPMGLDELLAEHLPRLRAFVRLHTDDDLRARESCSDLVQSVCKDLLGQRERFDYREEHAFRNWLYTAVLNKIRDHKRHYLAARRHPNREVQASSDVDLMQCYATICTPSHHAMARERLELFERAFAQLPEHYRRIISMARILGLPRDEIATELGKSKDSVKMELSRAMARLSSLMAGMDGEA